MVLASAIIGAATWAIGNVASKYKEQKQNKANATQATNTAARLRTEKEDATKLFDTEISTKHGVDFLNALKAGSLTSENLIAKLGSNTSYAKALAEYTRLGNQDMANAKQDTQITGLEATAASELSLSQMMALDMSQAQSEGAAKASGATSGIRTVSGTGANAETIQVLSNKLEKDTALKTLENQRSSAIHQMSGITRSGSQSAEAYRKKKETDATTILENALVAYSGYDDKQADLEQAAKEYDKDAIEYGKAADLNVLDWAVSWLGF
jgi:hypothetical protein